MRTWAWSRRSSPASGRAEFLHSLHIRCIQRAMHVVAWRCERSTTLPWTTRIPTAQGHERLAGTAGNHRCKGAVSGQMSARHLPGVRAFSFDRRDLLWGRRAPRRCWRGDGGNRLPRRCPDREGAPPSNQATRASADGTPYPLPELPQTHDHAPPQTCRPRRP